MMTYEIADNVYLYLPRLQCLEFEGKQILRKCPMITSNSKKLSEFALSVEGETEKRYIFKKKAFSH